MFKYIGRVPWASQVIFSRPVQSFATTHNVIADPTKNKYQESQMLFFSDPAPERKKSLVRPRTISEIKKLQNFVKQYKSTPGKSLNE